MRPGRADFAHLQRAGGAKPVLMLAESVQMGPDVTTTLTTLRRPLALDRYRCTALLRHGEYQLVQTEHADGAIEEAREAARWRLKDQVEFAVEDAAIDLLPIPADGRPGQAFAAISPAKVIGPLVQAFQSAKLGLGAIDLPEMSQRNLAALFEEDGRGLATLIFDDDEGLLTFTFGGELLVVRHVEQSAQLLAAADSERRHILLERIALDVQRSLDNFDRLYSSVSLACLLVAPIPGVPDLIPALKENLTVPVDALDLGKVIDFGKVSEMLDPLRQFQSLRAIGAALRDEPGT